MTQDNNNDTSEATIDISEKWQAEFTHSLFNGLSEFFANSLSTEGKIQQQQRFAIYQNNVFYSLTQALSDLYPVIEKLVGIDFFKATASLYIRQYQPEQPAIVFWGEKFPVFLAHFEHTKNMPYLAHVAQLELARHQAYHADDMAALEPSDFGSINEAQFENIKLAFHPSVHLLNSKYPIFHIWNSNQGNNDSEEEKENIQLDEPEAVIIVRYQYECLVYNVDLGTYRFYHALQEKMIIKEAVNYALEIIEFDISAAIALGIQNGFFSAILDR